MKALFSGRFDPVHPGHIAQVLRIIAKYDSVKIIILDYPNRRFPVGYIWDVFRECLPYKNVEITTNFTHFGELTKEEWDRYNCDIWVGGNLKVQRHLETLSIPCSYLPRAFDYEASKYDYGN